MRIPWDELEEGSDQGLEAFRGEGDWGVSTLRGYYERGQPLSPPQTQREPAVTLFETEAQALDYARKRARSASGTSYYVIDYRPDDAAIVYRVLRYQSGQKQRRKGDDKPGLLPSREMVMVFENMREDLRAGRSRLELDDGTVIYGAPKLKPDGRIRWKLLQGLSLEIQDPEEERETRAYRAGRLPGPPKPEVQRQRSLSPIERLVTRLRMEGYNEDEIRLAVADYRRRKGGLSGSDEDDEDRRELHFAYPDGTEVAIFVYEVCNAAAFDMIIDRPGELPQRFTGQEPGDMQHAEAAARRILTRALSRSR